MHREKESNANPLAHALLHRVEVAFLENDFRPIYGTEQFRARHYLVGSDQILTGNPRNH